MKSSSRPTRALEVERAAIVEWEERRAELQKRVESGEMTQDELEELEMQYEESLPDRVRAHREEAATTIDPAELEAATAPLLPQLTDTLAELPTLAAPATTLVAPKASLG